jgi:hypothetical protein
MSNWSGNWKKVLKTLENRKISKGTGFTVDSFTFQPLYPHKHWEEEGVDDVWRKKPLHLQGTEPLFSACPAYSLVIVLLIITFPVHVRSFVQTTTLADRWKGTYSILTIIITNWQQKHSILKCKMYSLYINQNSQAAITLQWLSMQQQQH